MELIMRQDVPLLVDVACAQCGREMALSNAYQHQGRNLCPQCSQGITASVDKLIGLLVWLNGQPKMATIRVEEC